MSVSRQVIPLRVLLVILVFGTTGCAEAKSTQRISLLPALEAMRPVVACLVEAKPGDSGAAKACATGNGIALQKSMRELPTLDDLKLQVIGMWLFLNQDPARRTSVSDFDQAIEFARCIESAAFAEKSFFSKTERGVAVARVNADAACRDHPLSMMRISPESAASGKPIDNAAQIMLARVVSGMAISYALEANGLMTDAMRPCVRYLDGRPPSPGCKGKPQGRPPPPPRP